MMLATRWAWVAAMGLGTCFALLISTQQANIGGKGFFFTRSKAVGS